MFVLSAVLWTCAAPYRFPALPIAAEVRRGQRAYALRGDIDSVWMEDRKPLGTWFDGRKKRPVEYAIWLSPRLVSRWFGYAAAREKWTDDQKRARWIAAQSILDGHMSFVVRLAAYPKVDLLNPEDAERPKLDDLNQIRFGLTKDGAKLPQRESPKLLPSRFQPPERFDIQWSAQYLDLQVAPIAELQGRSLGDVEGLAWSDYSPLVDAFAPEFAHTAPKGLNGLFGDFHARYFWVQTNLSDDLPKRGVELRVFSSTKERIATFDFVPRR